MNNCRVLLADDEAAILEGYKLLFDWEKYQCEVVGTAMDGREAVEKARELKPDIVIMVAVPLRIFLFPGEKRSHLWFPEHEMPLLTHSG